MKRIFRRIKAKIHIDKHWGFGLLISTGGIGLMLFNIVIEIDWN